MKKHLFTTTADAEQLQRDLLPAGTPSSWQQLQQQFTHVVLPHDAADWSGVPGLCDASEASAAIVTPGPQQQQSVEQLRRLNRSLFIIAWHPAATEDARMRWAAFQAGASMVTHCRLAIAAVLQRVAAQQQQRHVQPGSGSSSITCHWCGLPGLSPEEYWRHQPLWHIHEPNQPGTCAICGRFSHNLAVHLHNRHNPANEPPAERTGVFAICIVRRPSDGKFLMPQEFAGAGWWLPGGGVDRGETLTAAAHRECWEEAGVAIELQGLLAAQGQAGVWRKLLFYGEPAAAYARPPASSSSCAALPEEQGNDGSVDPWQPVRCACGAPKTLPDYESAGACWVAADELPGLVLRSTSDLEWMQALAEGTAGAAAADVQQLMRGLDELPEEWAELFEGFLLG